jgi:hypothetical protein
MGEHRVMQGSYTDAFHPVYDAIHHLVLKTGYDDNFIYFALGYLAQLPFKNRDAVKWQAALWHVHGQGHQTTTLACAKYDRFQEVSFGFDYRLWEEGCIKT